MNLVGALQRNPLVNSAVKTLCIHRVADAWLRRFPIRTRTASGSVYIVDSVSALVVAREIFSTDVYAGPVAELRPKTFVDLGSNVGYFPVLVADVTRSREIRGLCVEPNPQLQPLAQKHLRENSLGRVHLLAGAVGAVGSNEDTDFFLNPSHIASSLRSSFNPHVALGGKVEKIRVPLIDLDQEWQRHFAHERVGLLKVDIEGSELEFLRSHARFLERVDSILVEWHKWVTTREEIVACLAPRGFALHSVRHEDLNAGTALFLRRG